MEFSVSGFEEPRRAPTLININRVIPIGIAQDRGFVTMTLLSVEFYREGWRAQFRQHVHSSHPVINPYLKAFDSWNEEMRMHDFARGTRPTRPPQPPLYKIEAAAVDDRGTSYHAFHFQGNLLVREEVGDISFQFDPLPPGNATFVRLTIEKIRWDSQPTLPGEHPEALWADSGPWSWTVPLNL